jgi:hypothetical protein
MKWLVPVCFLAGPALALWSHFTNYWLGYSETETALLWCDPFVDLFSGAIVFLFILGVFFVALGKKTWRLPATLAVFAFWPLAFLTLWLLPAGGIATVHGLHDRILHDYKLDDLRRFAHEVDDAHLLTSGFINHGDINSLPLDQQAAFHRLHEHFPFMNWLRNGIALTGPSLINYQDPGVVNFEWGGALSGHWGCSIRLDGKCSDPSPGAYFYVQRASDDIYFYFE